MEEKNKNKSLILIIITIIVLVLGIAGYIVYDNFFKVDKNKSTASTSTTTTKKQTNDYTIKQTDKIAKANREYPLYKENSDEEGNIWLYYPEINYNTTSIKKLNQTIKKDIEKNILEIETGKNSFKDENNELNCDILTIKRTNETLEFERIDYIKYIIQETTDYISIVKYNISASDCASGYQGIDNSYVIDKKTKEILTIDEIIKKHDNFELLIETLKDFIQENYDELFNIFFERNEIVEIFNKEIKEKKYILYYNNENDLVITLKSFETEGSPNSFVLKENKWEPYYID